MSRGGPVGPLGLRVQGLADLTVLALRGAQLLSKLLGPYYLQYSPPSQPLGHEKKTAPFV